MAHAIEHYLCDGALAQITIPRFIPHRARKAVDGPHPAYDRAAKKECGRGGSNTRSKRSSQVSQPCIAWSKRFKGQWLGFRGDAEKSGGARHIREPALMLQVGRLSSVSARDRAAQQDGNEQEQQPRDRCHANIAYGPDARSSARVQSD
ncbi:hypothetical protein PMI02_02605 [Novosphingobium sp. AP12]|nr:hypothetical protein PMI02_02605 [Novosphingobium sp. AP12]